MDELMYPLSKRIKLEHSYAATSDTIVIESLKFEEEDPLKISPEDFNIKIENGEDNMIKQENIEDVDVHQICEYFNLPSISEQLENHSRSSSPTLLPDDESDSYNNVADCLELGDNCDVASKIDTCVSVNGESCDMVPKQVFLAFQQKYEKTIRDLKAQNEKILLISKRLTKENVKLQQEVDKAPFVRRTVQTPTELMAKIIKLQDEVRASKTREQSLTARVHIREQSLNAKGRSKMESELCDVDARPRILYINEIRELKVRLDHAQVRLKHLEQLRDDNFKTIRKTNSELHNLRVQLSTKKAELKRSEDKCGALASKLTDMIKENASQKSTLSKLQEGRRNEMEQELFDRMCTRQILTKRIARLNKKLREMKNNSCKRKLDETEEKLKYSIHRVKELEKVNEVERKNNSYLVRERDRLLEEEQVKYRRIQKQLLDANRALSAARGVLTRKIEESKNLRDGFRKATMQLNLKELLLKNKEEEVQRKDEAYRVEALKKEVENANALINDLSKNKDDHKQCELRCSRLVQKVTDLETELSKKESELAKAKEKIADVQNEFDEYVRLLKEPLEIKQREARHEEELRESVRRIVDLGLDLTHCRSLLNQKIEECESVTRELEKLTALLKRKEEEKILEEKARKKDICEYCGFEQ